MKILSLAFVGHDHNASYFDGKDLKYIKFERTKQEKRFNFKNRDDLILESFSTFGISSANCDVVVFIDMLPMQNTGPFPNLINYHPEFKQLEKFGFLEKSTFLFEHHYAHSLSVSTITDKKPTVHFVIDGIGHGKTWSVRKGEELLDFGTVETGSIGWGMRETGKLLGVTAGHYNDVAGKLMSLQSYGVVDKGFLEVLRKFDMSNINDIFNPHLWVEYINDLTLARNTLINWAATVNYAMHDVLLNHFKKYADKDDVITYSGGVAQNVVWNTTLKKHFKNLIIAPHSSDEGLSLGGVKWAADHYGINICFDRFPYCQEDATPDDSPTEETIKFAANCLVQGKTVGWYQGNGEIGPRALGNRSILMDPRIVDGKQKINRIKNRENYRPFGASVLKEECNKVFDIGWEDPYMLYVAGVKNKVFPAITHVDGTCRIQTVSGSNEVFYRLLKEFFLLTDCPVLLNTSMNLAGKPIAGSPDDALELFNTSDLDVLVVGNQIFSKGEYENTD